MGDDQKARLARRDVMGGLGAAMLAAGLASPATAQQSLPATEALPTPRQLRYPLPRPKVAMLVYPNMVMLDLVGPLTVFNILECELHLVWKDKVPVTTELGLPVSPTTSFIECPRDLDVLFVPGGSVGTVACMNDAAVLAFLADRGSRAKYVTSVCTGAMVLGAAGLLRGYRAATLWNLMEFLRLVGAIPVHERVVADRNRMTGGGVTAGIDFGLTIGAKLRGEDAAKRAQLIIEYAPAPPFDAGRPDAVPQIAADIKAGRPKIDAMIEAAARNAAASWK